MTTHDERLRRWRLVLGGSGENADGFGAQLSVRDQAIDATLNALYGAERTGSLAGSSPNVSRWLGDIRTYFPTSVVQVMQRDALERLDLKRMLAEPELLATIQADVHLVATLVALGSALPARSKETARRVVTQVAEDLRRRLEQPTRQAIQGALSRSTRTRRPRNTEIDWNRTIRANLKHYQVEQRTIVPETRIGYGRKRAALRDLVLCVDQSGSMARSVVYASIFSAVLASLPSVSTKLVVFDTSVVDLTEQLQDPVELLFGVQLGGGTDIARALGYCQGLVTRPSDTILVLVSDLFEGGSKEELLTRARRLVASGVQMIALLALDDEGAPGFDREIAGTLASMGVPAFACTPEKFPDLMAAAIQRIDLSAWLAENEIVQQRSR